MALAVCLLLSGCTWQEVNEYSLFKYRPGESAGKVALKTAGNIVPWAFEATCVGTAVGVYGAFLLGLAYLQGQSPR